MALENIDIQTITLAELAKVYSREQNLQSPLTLGTLLKQYANTPAIEVFEETDESTSIAKTVLREAEGKASESSQKGAMKALRYLSNRLYRAYDKNPPSFLIPNEKNTPKAAIEFFGSKEPPKAVSSLEVATDEKIIGEFFSKLARYAADNPEKAPEVRAIMFGMNTGLRPNANLGIKVGQYSPRKGAIYIPAEQTGAKKRAISIPLNNVADSMLQQQFGNFKEFMADENSVLFVGNDGKPLKTSDINAVLAEIKVADLVFDAETGEYFDSLKPEGVKGSKWGMSLFRNYHATRGGELGIDDGVLAKLQGRSLTSIAKKTGTGELYTYRSTYPFRVSEFERENANKFAADTNQYLAPALEELRVTKPEFTFDTGAKTDVTQTRFTTFTDESGKSYFERPTTDTPQPSKVEQKAAEKLSEADKQSLVGDILKGFGKAGTTALGALGIYGVAETTRLAYEKARGRGESMAMAGVEAGLTGLYEVAEPVPLGFMRPQPVGEGSDIVPTDETGQPQYPFLDKYEADQAAQNTNEEELLNGIQADIEITYSNEDKK